MDDKSYTVRVPKRWLRIGVTVGVTALIVAPLTAMASHSFGDVPDSNTFHEDIAWLADAEVTKGCNPPANTEFCPDDFVTREQMSAFMRRLAKYMGAEDGTPARADHATTADDADELGGKPAADYAENLWAVVNSDGTLARGSHVVSADVVGALPGRYQVIFDREVRDCSFVAGLGSTAGGTPAAGLIDTARFDGDPDNGVFVHTRDIDGLDANRSFHLIVQCGATTVYQAAELGGESQDG